MEHANSNTGGYGKEEHIEGNHYISCADCQNTVNEYRTVSTYPQREIHICIPCAKIDEALNFTPSDNSPSPSSRSTQKRKPESPTFHEHEKYSRETKAPRTIIKNGVPPPVSLGRKKKKTESPHRLDGRPNERCVKPEVAKTVPMEKSSSTPDETLSIQDVVDQLLLEGDLFEKIISFLQSDENARGTTSTCILLKYRDFRNFCASHNTFTPAAILEHCPGVSQLWGDDGKTKFLVSSIKSQQPEEHHLPTTATEGRPKADDVASSSRFADCEKARPEVHDIASPTRSKECAPAVKEDSPEESKTFRSEVEERIVAILKENSGEMSISKLMSAYGKCIRNDIAQALGEGFIAEMAKRAQGKFKMKEALLRFPSITCPKGALVRLSLKARITLCAEELTLTAPYFRLLALLDAHANDGVTLEDIKEQPKIFGWLVGKSPHPALIDFQHVHPSVLLASLPGVTKKKNRFYRNRRTDLEVKTKSK